MQFEFPGINSNHLSTATTTTNLNSKINTKKNKNQNLKNNIDNSNSQNNQNIKPIFEKVKDCNPLTELPCINNLPKNPGKSYVECDILGYNHALLNGTTSTSVTNHHSKSAVTNDSIPKNLQENLINSVLYDLSDDEKKILSEEPVKMQDDFIYQEPQQQQEEVQSQEPVYNIDEDDSEDEGIEDYKIGGYHPIHVGEVLQERYVVIQKLGWGHFSTVWLCFDFKFDSYVAVKVQKSAPNYMEAAYDEVEILQRVARRVNDPEWIRSLNEYFKDEGKTEFNRDDCYVVQLLNSFIYQGPYGNHFCMVFEIMGVNLLEIIKRYNYKGVPMHLCRRMTKQILIGLDYLHRICGIIHTDLKPENILLCLSQKEIIDIVEHGQLTRNNEYAARIREYQKMHGIQIEEPKIVITNTKQENTNVEQVTKDVNQNKENENDEEIMPKLTRKEKQKLRKKLKKQKAKLKKAGLDNKENTPAVDIDKTIKSTVQQIQKKEDLQKKEAIKIEKPARILKNKGRSYSYVEDEKYGPCMYRYLSLHNYMCETRDILDQKDDIDQDKDKWMKENNDQDINCQRGPKLAEDFKLKVVDLGNACWTHHQFSTEIQTRQYRSPEVIFGVKYGPSADIWSLACTLFEMLTGDFLFNPKRGPKFDQDDDHLALVMELLGKIPKKLALSGINSKRYFCKDGELRKIKGLHYWPLKNVLIDKYHFKESEATALTEFLLPMLDYYPWRRATAQQCLRQKWLKMERNLNFKYSEKEINQKARFKKNPLENLDLSSINEPESEDFDAENEINSNNGSSDEYDELSFDEHDNYGYNKVLNRSFSKTTYVPYGGGIRVEELDQDPNWQFIDATKI